MVQFKKAWNIQDATEYFLPSFQTKEGIEHRSSTLWVSTLIISQLYEQQGEISVGILKRVADNPLLKDWVRVLLSGEVSGLEQLRAAGRWVELSVLPKWGGSWQILDKFSLESTTTFFFLATGGGLLSLGLKCTLEKKSEAILCIL